MWRLYKFITKFNPKHRLLAQKICLGSSQNIQMMRSKPRKDGPSVNIVTRSSITTRDDKGKKSEENVWVCKEANVMLSTYEKFQNTKCVKKYNEEPII